MIEIRPSGEQERILARGPQSMRIRAGAGTGKTTTVAMVIANLVANHGIDPERVLGITFTNKAAAELAERVKLFLGEEIDEGRQAEVHTYHGFAAQILGEFGALAGLRGPLRVITPTFSRQILTESFQHTSYEHLDITYSGGVDKIRLLGDRLGDHLLMPVDLLGSARPDDDIWAKRLEMLETLSRYELDKRRLGVVDYSDLVTLSHRLMEDNPDLAKEIQRRYQTVVLDEYQDTNPAQRALLTTIFATGVPVIAVGDEDQTIYEWRGASAENFEQFPDHFRNIGGVPADTLSLTLNRRSADPILHIANQIRKRANPEAPDLISQDPEAPGVVITHWATDAIAEADWIARRLESLHQDGTPWSEMAVLFRKNKDFAVVVDSMSRHDIPVEVANLGGLLSVPEVGELRSWLSILERPQDSGALTQILFGSRYRLGLADLAPLTNWLIDRSRDDRDLDLDADDIPAVSLLEAIEHLDDVTDLRPEARPALAHFLDTYRGLLGEIQGMSLVETARLTLDRIRAWQDIEALPPSQRTTARLNLYRLLDLTEDWSPLVGRPSLGAFLDYLDAMEDEPAEELDSAHLSGEDAVTLVTVHRAKGLEWEVVVIPAVTEKSFPGQSQQYPDPLRFAEYLPPEFRIDEVLDDMPLDEAGRKEYFKARNDLQEWRVAYVAATRARSTLIVTGAYWYGLPEPSTTAKKPSALFNMIEEDERTIVEGHAEETPRPELLITTDEGVTPDPLFVEGWDGALRRAIDDEGYPATLARDLGHENEMRRRAEATIQTLFDLATVETASAVGPERRQVSVTGLVTYAQCPKRFFWSEVDPLPRRRNPAATAGTELHRKIELYQRGQVPFEEMRPDMYDAIGDGGIVGGGFEAFESSRYGKRSATLVESPFNLVLSNDYEVRGRIDAVYIDGGSWEIVDFKSGRPSDDPARVVQLEAYAVAAVQVDFGPPMPEEVTVSFVYLGGGLEVSSRPADAEWRRQAKTHLEDLTDAIEAGRFDATPGPWCRHCDFLRFCGPGLQEVSGE
ncbi:MAG: ATP-dependent DNA helicase [Acidimicrobiia bacterium]